MAITARPGPALALHLNDDSEATMFRLIATVKRGVSSDLDEVLTPYNTLDEARQAAQSLSRSDERLSSRFTCPRPAGSL